MPHVIVKMWPGKSEQQKREVYNPDIRDKWDTLYQKPGYTAAQL